MDHTIDELVDIDLSGYLEGENDPEYTEEHFDLHGRSLEHGNE